MSPTNDQLLRVFLVAHDARPPTGGPPSVGWSWARELDRRVDLTLVTHGRNRRHIERGTALRGRVLYVDTERFASALDGVGASAVSQGVLETVAFLSFDAEATRLAERLAKRGEIDVIHRVSPVAAHVPSRLGTVGVPFVIGPVAGPGRVATEFSTLSPERRATALMASPLGRLLDPDEQTYSRAATILVADEHARATLPESVRRRAEVMPHRGLFRIPESVSASRREGPMRAVFFGPLTPERGAEWALRGLARVAPEVSIQLDIFGSGPDAGRLERLVRSLGVASRVSFHGAAQSLEVTRYGANADLLVLPSIAEVRGGRVMQAMAAGTPLLLTDVALPPEIVPHDAGIRVETASPKQLAWDLSLRLQELWEDEPLRERLARSARRHALSDLAWPRKVERALEIYNAVSSRRRRRKAAPRPTLGASA